MGVYQQIQEKMLQLDIQPKRSLGQNFLVSDAIIEKILREVEKQKPEFIVEVGPGLGSLTEGLLQVPAKLQLLELDHKFVAYWLERGLDVIETDALEFDWTQLRARENRLLVSNLPYQISSRLVIDRSLDAYPFKNMILMFQREVADRITSKPHSKEYGFLSVMAQSFWNLKTITDVGPQCFLPPPNVSSRVLHFQHKPSEVNHPKFFFKFIKSGFLQRRKLYLKNIRGFLKDHHLEESRLKQILLELQLKDTVRAEEISVAQYLTLYKKLWPIEPST